MIYKFLALQLLWLSSTTFYCGSQKQQLLPQPLSRILATWALIIGCGLAVILLSQLYHWLSASFSVMAVLMLCWCLLALLSGHCKRVSTVIATGVLMMTLLALLGGKNVA